MSNRFPAVMVVTLIGVAGVKGMRNRVTWTVKELDAPKLLAVTGEGVAFHLIGALSEFGKLGVVCIGPNQDRADALYQRTVEVLDSEGAPAAAVPA